MTTVAAQDAEAELSFVWLEITGKCQLECVHCYAESGPRGTHGAMSDNDWLGVIDEAAELGVTMIQFIGGEPTLHPSFPDFVGHALGRGLSVEVFSNLVHVSPRLWEVFSLPGVRLATSYYADWTDQHEQITGRRGSHTKTMNNIREAVRRSIPLRVGLIDMHDGQRVEQARHQLEALGVTEVRTARLRQVGRGIRDQQASAAQLCGACGHGKVAISPTGDVWPCVFARWMTLGNVRDAHLAEIVTVPRMREVTRQLTAARPCHPDSPGCFPNQCDPLCPPSCSPSCNPRGDCRPAGGCAPSS